MFDEQCFFNNVTYKLILYLHNNDGDIVLDLKLGLTKKLKRCI